MNKEKKLRIEISTCRDAGVHIDQLVFGLLIRGVNEIPSSHYLESAYCDLALMENRTAPDGNYGIDYPYRNYLYQLYLNNEDMDK